MNKYKVNIPEGESGAWKVSRFEVTKKEAEFQLMRSAFNGGRGVPEGTYTKLTRNNYLIMSDTPNEIKDHLSFIGNATGNVLINGLGIGMVLQAVLNKPEVTHVTVIEMSEDVIALVAPFYQDIYGDKLTIIHADAYEYKPPKNVRYDAIWHDIWDDICTDNLEGMKKLHRKYGRHTDYQGSWCRGILESQRKRERNTSWRFY
jgi:hypothetical protein